MIAVQLGVRFVEGVDVLALLLGHVPHPNHMLPGKQQVLWIHKTGFNEALVLLRTPARICFIHQAAFGIEKVVEIAPGPRKLLPEVLTTDLNELCTYDVGHAEDLSEDVDQALLAIETEHHSRRAADSSFVHPQL